jgi:hypothetical protein
MKTSIYKSILILILFLLVKPVSLFAQDDKDDEGGKKEYKKEKSYKKEKACKDSEKNLERTFEQLGETLESSFKEVGREFENEFGTSLRDLSLHIGGIVNETVNEVTNEIDGDAKWNSSDSFDEEKSKKLSKSYKVNASQQLVVENKFGKVHINTWDKNEITVEVTMIGRANSPEKAQEVLDLIDVKVNEEGNAISFRTEIGKMNNNKNNGKKGFEINYTVNMPRNNSLQVKNSFGDVYLASFNGKANVEVSYGSLKADKLNSADTNVKVSFGSGHIGYVKGGNVEISYGDLDMESTGNINLTSGFSKVKVEQTKDMVLKAKYGGVRIGSANSLEGSAGFSEFRIERVMEKIDMKVQYCNDFEIKEIDKSFKLINLDGGFSSIDLNFARNINFDFDVNLQFADLDTDGELTKFSLVEKKSNSKLYKGTFGKPGGGNIKIVSRYGNVDFNIND